MRFLRRSVALSLLLTGCGIRALAQQQSLTDAQRMDLVGPVKSVSVTATQTGIVWNQPSGPSMVDPIWCSECEFDQKGNRTKFGQMIDGRFQGEIIHLLLDGQGNVIERIEEDASTGETTRRETVGPFGNKDEFSYRSGELQSHALYSYDEHGNRIDWLTLDGAGKQLGRTIVKVDGNDTEQWAWGKEGELALHVLQTFDPKTKIERFTSFDSSGSAKLTWTLIDGKLSSYWQLPGSSPEYGDAFSEDVGNDTFRTYHCQSDQTCKLSRVHYVYLDAKRRNPQSVEWRDEAGELRYAAYYEYELDAHRNWTHRTIWVWSQSLGERKLYETDSRAISYWP
jgi:hypothetical protein